MEIKNIECSWRDQLDLSCEMDLCAIGDAYLIVCVCVCVCVREFSGTRPLQDLTQCDLLLGLASLC